MTKKVTLVAVLVLAVAALAATALAQGPGYGRGMGYGYGQHMMAGYGSGWGPGGADGKFYEETIKLRGELQQKHEELRVLLSKPEVDEAKAKALNAEINKLRNDLSQKRLEAMLEFKKKNPDWNPGYGMGPGRMSGGGMGRGACQW
ncbi:MAG: periplasmic heavy metal sensor [Thermodesulfobacteriota bacterium]